MKTSMKLRDKLYKETIKENDSQKKSRNMKLTNLHIKHTKNIEAKS